MSIKSDRWIRRMVEQQKMIEPFEPGQVKHAADGDSSSVLIDADDPERFYDVYVGLLPRRCKGLDDCLDFHWEYRGNVHDDFEPSNDEVQPVGNGEGPNVDHRSDDENRRERDEQQFGESPVQHVHTTRRYGFPIRNRRPE